MPLFEKFIIKHSSEGGGSGTFGSDTSSSQIIYESILAIKNNLRNDLLQNSPGNILDIKLTRDESVNLIMEVLKENPSEENIKLIEKIYLKAILISAVENLENSAMQLNELDNLLIIRDNQENSEEELERFNKEVERVKETLNTKKMKYQAHRNEIKNINESFEQDAIKCKNIITKISGTFFNFDNFNKKNYYEFIYEFQTFIKKASVNRKITESRLKTLIEDENLDIASLNENFSKYLEFWNFNIEKSQNIRLTISKYFESDNINNDFIDNNSIALKVREVIKKDLSEFNFICEIYNKILRGEKFDSNFVVKSETITELYSKNLRLFPNNIYKETGISCEATSQFLSNPKNILIYGRPVKNSNGEARFKINFYENNIESSSVRIDQTHRGLEMDIQSESMDYIVNTNPSLKETHHYNLNHLNIFEENLAQILKKYLPTLKEETVNGVIKYIKTNNILGPSTKFINYTNSVTIESTLNILINLVSKITSEQNQDISYRNPLYIS